MGLGSEIKDPGSGGGGKMPALHTSVEPGKSTEDRGRGLDRERSRFQREESTSSNRSGPSAYSLLEQLRVPQGQPHWPRGQGLLLLAE
jgi:hypothetical protein